MHGSTITQRYGHHRRFLTALVVAELHARTDWEIEFTGSLRDRYEKHGARMLLSDLQETQLNRIATID